MSANSKALQMLRALINEVQAVPVSTGGGGGYSAPAKVSTDAAWDPIVPPGHSAFSWGSGPAPASAGKAKIAAANKSAAAPTKAAKENNKNKKKSNNNQQKGGKAAPAAEASLFYKLDIRVGKIVKAFKHPEADRLYVEHIDLGEESPRQICSGLVEHIPLDQVQGATVLVVTNLKPTKMVGVVSYGMVLCAMNAEKTKVEFVTPPANAYPGARVYLEGDSSEDLAAYVPEENINGRNKKSSWAKVAPELQTDGNRTAMYQGRALRVRGGVLSAPTVASGLIS